MDFKFFFMSENSYFTSDFTWDVSPARDRPYEKWVKGTSEIPSDFEKFSFEFSLVKMRTSHTIFYMERHLFFTGASGHVPRDSQGDKWNFFFWNWRGGWLHNVCMYV